MRQDNIFETPEILTGFESTAGQVGAPRIPSIDELASPIQQQSAETLASRETSGAFAPTLGDAASLAQQEDGFWSTVGQGFDEGVIGFALETGPKDFAGQERLRQLTEGYAQSHGFRSFAASLIGRSVSDLPVDIAVGVATSGWGNMMKTAARTSQLSAGVTKKIETSVDALQAIVNKGQPNYLSGAWKNAQQQFVEGLLAGAISEAALQNMGKYGTTGDIIRASIEDAIGGVVLGEFFRGVGYTMNRKKLAEEWSTAVEALNGMKKAETQPEIEAYLLEVEEAQALTQEAERAQALARGEQVDQFTEAETDLGSALRELGEPSEALDNIDRVIYEAQDDAPLLVGDLEADVPELLRILADEERVTAREDAVTIAKGKYGSPKEIRSRISRLEKDLGNAKTAAVKQEIETEIVELKRAEAVIERKVVGEDKLPGEQAVDDFIGEQRLSRGQEKSELYLEEKLQASQDAIIELGLKKEFDELVEARRLERAKRRSAGITQRKDVDDLNTEVNAELEADFMRKVEARRLERAQRRSEARKAKQEKVEASKRKIQEAIDQGKQNRREYVEGLRNAQIKEDEAQLAQASTEYLEALLRDSITLTRSEREALLELDAPDPIAQIPKESRSTVQTREARADFLKNHAPNLDKYPLLDDGTGRRLRALFGDDADLKALSKETKIPVAELKDLKTKLMATARDDMDFRDDLSVKEAREEALRSSPESSNPPGQLRGVAIRTLQDLAMFGKLSGLSNAKVKMLTELFKVRAKVAGVSIETYLKGKKLEYSNNAGDSFVLFNDLDTLINVPRDTADAGKFFHEIGHIIEQDLTRAERIILANAYFPKSKGKLREVNLFGRAFSEKFANDFNRYLTDIVAGRETKGLSDALKGVFSKIARWTREIYSTLFGDSKYVSDKLGVRTEVSGKRVDTSDMVQDVFDMLFDADRLTLMDTPRAEFVQRGRAARGSGRVDATSASFQNWFGNSKVVGADGKPLVVYHGTGKDFSSFKGNTKWATDAVELAEEYAYKGGRETGANVKPVYLHAENPLEFRRSSGPMLTARDLGVQVMNRDGAKVKALSKGGKEELKRIIDSLDDTNRGNLFDVWDDSAEFVELAKLLGYDSIKSTEGGFNTYAVFDSTQIKSVFNEGTFDPNNTNILKATTAKEAEALLRAEGNPNPTKKQVEKRQVEESMTPEQKRIKALNEKDAVRLAQEANDIGSEIDKAPGAQSTVTKWLRDRLPKGFVSGIYTLKTMMALGGETLTKKFRELQEARFLEDKYRVDNYDILTSAAERHGFVTGEDGTNEAIQTAMANAIQKDTVSAVPFKGGERIIKQEEALLLHLDSLDGKADAKSQEAMKNSGNLSLKSNGYRFREDKVPTEFTEAQVDQMGSEAWLESVGGEELVRVAAVLKETMKESGDTYAKWYASEFGEPPWAEGHFYFPKFTEGVTRDVDIDSIVDSEGNILLEAFQMDDDAKKQLASLVKNGDHRKVMQTLADTTTMNNKRSGLGQLKYQNPFDATIRYMDQQARMRAMAKPLAEVQLLMRSKPVQQKFKNLIGEDVYGSLTHTLDNMAGNLGNTDPLQGKMLSRLYKGQIYSALSWNMSTPFKQFPSIALGLDRLENIGGGPGNVAKYLQAAMGKDSKDIHAMLMEKSPTYRIRYTMSGQSPDLSDARLTSAFSTVFGDTKLSSALERGGPVEGAKNFVEKGMHGIRWADAGVIRALYLAAVDDLEVQKGRKLTDADDADVEKLVATIIADTQPSFHPMERTTLQNSRDFLSRQLAMFSSPSVKFFNAIHQDFTALRAAEASGDKEAISKLKKRVNQTAAILAFQSAGVAGVGSAAVVTKGELFDLMKSDEHKAQRDAFLESHGLETVKYWDQLFRGAFGNLPYTGQFLSEGLKRGVFGDGFDLEVMPINYINDMYNWLGSIGDDSFGRNSMELMESMAKLTGTPLPVVQTIKAGATNL